jgi:hypothetical protein
LRVELKPEPVGGPPGGVYHESRAKVGVRRVREARVAPVKRLKVHMVESDP